MVAYGKIPDPESWEALNVHYMQICRDLGGHPEVSPEVGRVEEDWPKAMWI